MLGSSMFSEIDIGLITEIYWANHWSRHWPSGLINVLDTGLETDIVIRLITERHRANHGNIYWSNHITDTGLITGIDV